MQKHLTAFLGPLVLVLSAPPSAAATVYSQPVLSTSATLYASQNDSASGGFGSFAKVFDNFRLGETTSITDVHWFGGFFSGSTPALPASPAPISSFLIQFWSDASGAPGTALYAATVDGNAGQTASGSNAFGPLYAYNGDLATAFLAEVGTTYWLSIQPTMAFPPQWGWAAGTGGDSVSYQDFNVDQPSRTRLTADMAFSLTSTTPSGVPEPGSLALAGLALAGLIAVARVKKAG